MLGYGARQFEEQDLKGLRFSEVWFRGSEFVGQDLRGCTFEQCDFTDVRFSECDLRDAVFQRCNLTDAKMEKGCNLSKTRFDDSIIRGLQAYLTPEQFESTYSFKAKDLQNCWVVADGKKSHDFRGLNLAGVRLLGDVQKCDFTNAIITNARMGAKITVSQVESTKSYKSKRLLGVEFYSALEGIDLSGMSLWGAKIRSVNGNFEGAEISKCFIRRLTKDDIRATKSFQTGLLDTITFNGIDFSGVSFDDMTLSRCVFTRCNLLNATFENTVVSGTRFSSCNGMSDETLQSTWNAKTDRMHDVKVRR